MTKAEGMINKMSVKLVDPVNYELSLGDQRICLNDGIGKSVVLRFKEEIRCVDCGKVTRKSFFNGFCYPCFQSSPMASACIVNPEKCQAQDGLGRDMEWEASHHLQPHIVYLSHTSGVKVGVTGAKHKETRWIDQGASQAIVLAETPNRFLAGCIEVALKPHIQDKTHWKRMLSISPDERADLISTKDQLRSVLPSDLKPFICGDNDITQISYPVVDMPEKFKSVNFDKVSEIGGTLTGIKGQYLIFKEGFVFNVRRHSGYMTALEMA